MLINSPKNIDVYKYINIDLWHDPLLSVMDTGPVCLSEDYFNRRPSDGQQNVLHYSLSEHSAWLLYPIMSLMAEQEFVTYVSPIKAEHNKMGNRIREGSDS